MEKLSYYTTCHNCEDESGIETALEGVGDYDREENTLFALPCPVCSYEHQFDGWLDECQDCGELHYESDLCKIICQNCGEFYPKHMEGCEA